MSDHYHDENDLKLMREMRKLAPEEFDAWSRTEQHRRSRQLARFPRNIAS